MLRACKAVIDSTTLLCAAMLQREGLSSGASLLHQMSQLGITPDTVTLTSLMKAASDAGQYDLAVSIFDEMLCGVPLSVVLGGRSSTLGADSQRDASGDAEVEVDSDRLASNSAASSSRDFRRGNDLESSGASKVNNTNCEAMDVVHAPANNTPSGHYILNGSSQSNGNHMHGQGQEPVRHGSSNGTGQNGRIMSSNWETLQGATFNSSGVNGYGSEGSNSQPSGSVSSLSIPSSSGRSVAFPGGPDVIAWNVLVDILVAAGRMTDAEVALERAVQTAHDRQQQPPQEAFGALIKG